jgi:hypothetical protein
MGTAIRISAFLSYETMHLLRQRDGGIVSTHWRSNVPRAGTARAPGPFIALAGLLALRGFDFLRFAQRLHRHRIAQRQLDQAPMTQVG